MSRTYYTLLGRYRDDQPWEIEFGDYDREAVITEWASILDSHAPSYDHYRLIRTSGDDQATMIETHGGERSLKARTINTPNTRNNTMKIKNIAPNQTELHKDDGTIVFVSYETPVAAFVDGFKWIRSEEKYSPTTSKHVNKWLSGLNVETVSQKTIDDLMVSS